MMTTGDYLSDVARQVRVKSPLVVLHILAPSIAKVCQTIKNVVAF